MSRNTRWHWILLDNTFKVACIMDDFGDAIPVPYVAVRISLRAGDA